jgi:hypothetical protein
MVIVQRLGPRPVALGVLVWSIAVGCCFFFVRAQHHLGISSGLASLAWLFAGLLTVAVGCWLGWRHRSGTAFVAPLMSWLVLVPFAFASEFVRAGFFSGLWRGVVVAALGGFVVASVEGIVLVFFAFVGRIASGRLSPSQLDSTVIYPPRSG